MATADPTTVRTARGAISCREAGAGEPLVLLHGIGSGSASWAAQLESLSGRFRVVAWDAPGYGGSDALAGDTPTADDYAASLAAFLDALEIGVCRLVGHSLGALIACAFARATPERVRALMLADPAAGYANADPAVRAERMMARLDLIDRLGPERMADERSGALLSEGASDEAKERVRAVMASVRPDGYRQAVAMLFASDIHADARAVRLPVLVACGGDDTVTPPESCRRIAASFPDARFELLPGLGHACYVEDPAAFDAALLGFFASDSAGEAS